MGILQIQIPDIHFVWRWLGRTEDCIHCWTHNGKVYIQATVSDIGQSQMIHTHFQVLLISSRWESKYFHTNIVLWNVFMSHVIEIKGNQLCAVFLAGSLELFTLVWKFIRLWWSLSFPPNWLSVLGTVFTKKDISTKLLILVSRFLYPDKSNELTEPPHR